MEIKSTLGSGCWVTTNMVFERTWVDVLKNGMTRDRIIKRGVIELSYIFLLGNKTNEREQEEYDMNVKLFDVLDRLI